MPAEPQASPHGLWTQVLEAMARTVPPHSFNTWFVPLALAGLGQDACHLIAPSDYFRSAFLTQYAGILDTALAQLVAPSCRLHIDVQTPDLPATPESPWPVVRASEIPSEAGGQPWLIERLWSAQAVGFVAGPPKSYKTWTVLEMAVAVASGTPCLGAFPVHRSGPVLLYAAEDSMPALRLRLQALAANHQLPFDQLDIGIIQVDALRLDRPADRDKLTATVAVHRPALLILDPLVRLHGLDENQAGPMADLLSHIRSLQRATGTAIAIVHHATKNSAHSASQSLRGSSDLYAFVDSLVLLQRRHGRVVLSAEHRSAPGLPPLPIELVATDDPAPALRLVPNPGDAPPKQDTLEDRIVALLSESPAGCTADSIRAVLQVRNQRQLDALRALSKKGLIRRDGTHYFMAHLTVPVPDA